MHFSRALILFTKLPVPGRVKTRMLGALTPPQAAELHRACLRDSLALLRGSRGAERIICVAGSPRAAQELAAALRISKSWQVTTQRGGDLGARMQAAAREALRRGACRVVIVGTDTPWMGARRIGEAFRALDRADVVLGPARDGGYYLLGLRRIISQMFREIPWGTPRVLPTTLRRLRAARANYVLLKEDFDLDVPQDLLRARRMLKGRSAAPYLRLWLTQWRRESSRRPAPRRRSKTPRPGPA
jgi:rSAM/selenodomain-associated transferase 1